MYDEPEAASYASERLRSLYCVEGEFEAPHAAPLRAPDVLRTLARFAFEPKLAVPFCVVSFERKHSSSREFPKVYPNIRERVFRRQLALSSRR